MPLSLLTLRMWQNHHAYMSMCVWNFSMLVVSILSNNIPGIFKALQLLNTDHILSIGANIVNICNIALLESIHYIIKSHISTPLL